MSPTFRSFRHHDYRLYWSGMLVSNVGTWMQRVAQDWLVLVVLGAGPASLGIATGLHFLPFLLVAPVGGLLADRFPKHHLLKATNAFLGAVGLTLGVLVLSDVVQVWHVYVLAFLLGVGAALDNPARQAFASELVKPDDLPNAVALNSASFNAARLVGPAVAGLLIAVIGTGWVFIVNGLSYAAPIIALTLLRRRITAPPRTDVDGGPLARLAEGVRYVRGRPDLLMLMGIMFFVGTFGMNFQMTFALMATEVFGKGPAEYGILGSIMAIGTLTGALIAARRRGTPRRRLVVLGACAFGTLEVVAGLMPTYMTFAVSLVPIGIAAMTVLTAGNAYTQTTVPKYVRGRVMSLYMMVLLGGTPLGAPIIGQLAEVLGARWSLLGGGGLTVLGTVLITVATARRNGLVLRPHLRPSPGVTVRAIEPPRPDESGPAATAA
ncbi:MAG TPA: MFS transporter [Jiangellaceae bacterium]|nr:MFS transporter [Jiangellaceae bacterium]